MTPFFITGLPRSRTAWLANFFTTDHSFCYHDISRVGSVWSILESTSSDFVGDSDSGLLTLVDSLLIRYPMARWLFLHNTVDRATKSFERYFTVDNEYPGTKESNIREAMEIAKQLYDIAVQKVNNKMEIEVDELDNFQTVKQVWQWLLPLPWNQQRYTMLNTFRINIIPQKLCLL
jgi:hypothetical protein